MERHDMHTATFFSCALSLEPCVCVHTAEDVRSAHSAVQKNVRATAGVCTHLSLGRTHSSCHHVSGKPLYKNIIDVDHQPSC